MLVSYSSTKGSDRATDIQKHTGLRCIQCTVLVWISLPERCIGRDFDHMHIDTSASHIVCLRLQVIGSGFHSLGLRDLDSIKEACIQDFHDVLLYILDA